MYIVILCRKKFSINYDSLFSSCALQINNIITLSLLNLLLIIITCTCTLLTNYFTEVRRCRCINETFSILILSLCFRR